MAKVKTVFICASCGYKATRWLGRCPDCQSFNTMSEEVVSASSGNSSASKTVTVSSLATLNEIQAVTYDRIPTNIAEFDRVLSGGIVEGSLILLGGEPGVGKSTLLLQICQNVCLSGNTVLYVSGEESAMQIKLRAERLNVTSEKLYILSETSADIIEQTIKKLTPNLIIIDSIQTMFCEGLASSPGSVSQVRECTGLFMKIAKGMSIPIIIVGHVTKEGAIAGPKILEHIVDTVLYFEGERKEMYRIIRAVKNRFGSTNEIGVFEMQEAGLSEIKNPSEFMLFGRPINVSGSIVTCAVEGTRPILAEVQALVTPTGYGMARRMATGVDLNRVTMLIAVLEKKLKMALGNYDSYVNIAGGMKIIEPALDAAVVSVIASSFKNKAIDPYTMVFGEVGLAGEIRAVTMPQARVLEAEKLGFKHCVLPSANIKGLKRPESMRVFGVGNVAELLDCVMG